jgi:CRP-like cAMP-binding protein
MDLEMTNELSITAETLDRLVAAADMLQQAAERLADRESSFAIAAETDLAQRLAATETQLAAAQSRITELSASAPVAVTHHGRKTVPTAMVNLLAKQGVSIDSIEAGAIDAALVSLSIEQRIAVKAQLLRAGLLG